MMSKHQKQKRLKLNVKKFNVKSSFSENVQNWKRIKPETSKNDDVNTSKTRTSETERQKFNLKMSFSENVQNWKRLKIINMNNT